MTRLKKMKGLSNEEKEKNLENLIRRQEKKGRVVILNMTPDGHSFCSYNLEEFISQPTEGLLYDLNRLPEVIMTYIDDPKWVTDYAVYLVIKKLKECWDKNQASDSHKEQK